MRTIDDLISMAMFARVVDARSFTAAAQQLGVSKSLLSKRVSQLEERMGMALLHRTTRRLSLTTEGARVHAHCLTILRAADDATLFSEARSSEPQGLLRISCSQVASALFLDRALVLYLTRYPKVQVEISSSNTMVDLVLERIDVALRMSASLESSSLIAKRIATRKKVICASPAYLAKIGVPKEPDDLRAHACLHFSPLSREVEWRFGDVVIPTSGPISSDNPDTLIEAAVAGLGLVNMPRAYVAEHLAARRLVPVLVDYAQPARGVFAVYLKAKVVPAKVKKLIECLVQAAVAE